jgi:hypothetical protein
MLLGPLGHGTVPGIVVGVGGDRLGVPVQGFSECR